MVSTEFVSKKMLRKCLSCRIYTFRELCPKCRKKTIIPLPPKYSPEDKYGFYRRKLIKSKINKNKVKMEDEK